MTDRESISVVIPARNEAAFIGRCLESIRAAASRVDVPVEIVVVLNRCSDATEDIAREHGARIAREDARSLARIRNAGVRASSGAILMTLDADSWMSPNMLSEVLKKLRTGRYAGGGVHIRAERMSPGIFFSLMTFAPKLIWQRTWAGMFWLRRETFEAVGGFNEELVSVEDVDFARRLQEWGKSRHLKYALITRAHITTSSRKFDQFGDWFMFKNPGFVRRILTGKDRKAADQLYYDVER